MKKLFTVITLSFALILSVNASGKKEAQGNDMNPAAPDRPMRILLVNDDGYESIGIRQLAGLLEERGYDVWSVAPETNQSGIGTAITFKPGKPVRFTNIGGNHYYMPGTPSDCLLLGLTALMAENPPDLVISGVNDGPNVGVSQFNSGTVGGAMRAVKHGFPAIASSVGFRMEEMKEGFPSTMVYLPEAVVFTVDLVDRLNENWKNTGTVLPAGTGLSINYPAWAKEDIQGIAWPVNPRPANHQFVYQVVEDGVAVPVPSKEMMSIPETPDPLNDEDMLNHRYITIELLSASWHAGLEKDESLIKLIEGDE